MEKTKANAYNQKMNELLKVANEIKLQLEKDGKKLVSDELLGNFGQEIEKIRRGNEAEEESEERKLRIGIVGEMKAGKSSFLNSLVFDGEDYLPKAPTPMTAVLTIIGYSKQPSAEVIYYSQKDWEIIEKQEEDYQAKIDEAYREVKKQWEEEIRNIHDSKDMPEKPTKKDIELQIMDSFDERVKSGHELYAKISQLDYKKYIDKKIELKEGDILKELDNYVGSKGTHTPMVKHVKLYLAKEKLKGLEIIDTPGLNDPVVSRSRETTENLQRCDVVFMLSRSSQFFTAQDLSFLKNEVAKANIKKAVLVATQLDASILTYPSGRRKIPFADAYLGTIEGNKKHAEKTLEAQCKISTDPEIVATLKGKGCLPIINELAKNNVYFVSSYFYKAAKELERYKKIADEGVLQVFRNLERRFIGSCIKDLTKENLLKMAGIDKLKEEVLRPILMEKDKIIADKLAGRCDNAVGNLINLLEEIKIDSVSKQKILECSNMEKLKSMRKDMKRKLDNARRKIKGVFEDGALAVDKSIPKTMMKISEAERNYKELEKYEKRHEYITHDGWGPFSKEYTHVEFIYHYKSADVTNNADSYRDNIAKIANTDIDVIFDRESIANNVKNAILQAYNTSSSDFEREQLKSHLDRELEKIKAPRADFTLMKKYKDTFDKKVEYTIYEREERMSQLKSIQNEVLSAVRDEAFEILNAQKDKIKKELAKNAGIFVDQLEKKVISDISAIEQQMQNKEESIRQHIAFQDNISAMKKRLLQFS